MDTVVTSLTSRKHSSRTEKYRGLVYVHTVQTLPLQILLLLRAMLQQHPILPPQILRLTHNLKKLPPKPLKRGSNAAVGDEFLLHPTELEAKRQQPFIFPNIYHPSTKIDADIHRIFCRVVERLVRDGESQQAEVGRVAREDERERFGDDAADSAA